MGIERAKIIIYKEGQLLMKWLAILTLCTVFHFHARAQENATTEPPVDNKTFNQDIDDFEKNMNKEVPPPKKKSATAESPVDNTEKSREVMKKQLAANGKPA